MNTEGIKVTDHAIERFKERTGCNKSSGVVTKRLLYMLEQSQEVTLKKHYGTIALLNHGLRPAQYYRYNDFIMVVENSELKTIHKGEAKRWT